MREAGAGLTEGMGERVIRTLYRITSNYAAGFEAQVHELLELGRTRFDLDIGILARIERDTYTVVHTVVPSHVDLNPGDTFSLANTYCSLTLEAGGPIGFEHVGQTTLRSHPAYIGFQLESYVGVPLLVDGEPYGTLNFSSADPRPRKFDAADLDAVQLMATWIGAEIRRRRSESEIRDAITKLDRTERTALVGEIVGTYQHEINNPLAAALGCLSLLEPAGDSESQLVRDATSSLMRIRDVLREMGHLVEAGPDRVEMVDLPVLVHDMLADARWRRRFRTQLDPVRVPTLEPRLYQALHNVLMAHMHGLDGPGPDPILVTCGRSGDDGFVRVESGCRVPMASARRDILSGLRGETPLADVPLALAERIARQLGGSLGIEHTETGLVTEISLPLRTDA